MGYQFKFNKILHLKEREKDEANTVYNESVKSFEEAAEKLYEFLKKKEDINEYQASKLTDGLSVHEIRHHQHFLAGIDKTIEHYQKMVANARNRMVFSQEKLMEKNVEVKKYEKIKEKDFHSYKENMKYTDGRQMDDISIQQYMNRGS